MSPAEKMPKREARLPKREMNGASGSAQDPTLPFSREPQRDSASVAKITQWLELADTVLATHPKRKGA